MDEETLNILKASAYIYAPGTVKTPRNSRTTREKTVGKLGRGGYAPGTVKTPRTSLTTRENTVGKLGRGGSRGVRR